jgi:hypothetical protein
MAQTNVGLIDLASFDELDKYLFEIPDENILDCRDTEFYKTKIYSNGSTKYFILIKNNDV